MDRRQAIRPRASVARMAERGLETSLRVLWRALFGLILLDGLLR